jgi:branched-chain amino acid transport system ATP-binding protein
MVTLLGPNGAGKTTIVRGIGGFLSRDRVSVRADVMMLGGHDLRNMDAERRARLGIRFVPERDKVFRNLSISANLELRLPRRPAEKHAQLDLIHETFPVLASLDPDRPAGYLSGGQRQMLALAMALAGAPSLLIVDEATLGLAPIAIEQLAVSLRKLRDNGLTILLAEQNVRLALEVSDYLYALSRGGIVEEGPVDEWHEVRLREAYLG